MKHVSLAAPLICILAAAATAQDLDSLIRPQLPALVDTYKGIHAHPELSHHEERTSAMLGAELRKAGYTVTERVGKYPDGSQAYGIVAILENGAGPAATDSRRHGCVAHRRGDRRQLRQPREDEECQRPGCGRHARLRT